MIKNYKRAVLVGFAPEVLWGSCTSTHEGGWGGAITAPLNHSKKILEFYKVLARAIIGALEGFALHDYVKKNCI